LSGRSIFELRSRIPIGRQIIPVGIIGADKIYLPCSRPFLEPLFALNSSIGVGAFLSINEKMLSISFRESLKRFIFMLKNSRFQVAGDADVQRTPWLVRYDVNEEALFHLDQLGQEIGSPA